MSSSGSVKVVVHGAAGEVTGSCTEIITPHARLLIDFGMFQGGPEQEPRNALLPPVDFQSLSAVVVTHAHVDHCGRLGMLEKLGFVGPVLCTEATAELLPRVMLSSATLQQTRVHEYREGTAPTSRILAPQNLVTTIPIRSSPPLVLFTHRHAEAVIRRLRAVAFQAWERIAEGIDCRFHFASHVIGAASVEVRVQVPGRSRAVHLLFSGDLGPLSNPLLAPHQWPHDPPDLVVMESTNGARRFSAADRTEAFYDIMTQARREQQRVLVPTFALGRAQTLLQLLASASRAGILAGMPVYLDSAMAVRATELYARNPSELAPSVSAECMRGVNPLHFPELHALMSRRESEAIDRVKSGCVVLAGSGFCDAGPILRHLRLGVDQPDTRVLLTGHQLDGLLGHGLLHGATRVEINGAALDVKARIDRIEGVSGHADANDLLEWLRRMPALPQMVVLNHGAEQARAALAADVRTLGVASVLLPSAGQLIEVN